MHKTPFVEIFDLQGVHSGADAVSGDFSFGAGSVLYEIKATPSGDLR